MNISSPETGAIKLKTVLNKPVTENARFSNELVVDGTNLGADKWDEMFNGTLEDGKERGLMVFYHPIKRSYVTSKISVGSTKNVSHSISDLGIKGFFLPETASIHTHPPAVSETSGEYLATSPPGDKDLQTFLSNTISAMIVLDRSGAHMLVRTNLLPNGQMPNSEDVPNDLVQNIIEEIKKKDGTTVDVQKEMSKILPSYGIGYFFTSEIHPDENGNLTFRRP